MGRGGGESHTNSPPLLAIDLFLLFAEEEEVARRSWPLPREKKSEREPNECECIDSRISESAAEPDGAGMLLLMEFIGRRASDGWLRQKKIGKKISSCSCCHWKEKVQRLIN